MVRATIGVALAVVIATAPRRAAADDLLDGGPPRANTWIAAEFGFGVVEPAMTPWLVSGVGLELRRRIVGGLSLGVRGALLAAAVGYDPAHVGMPDNRHGSALQAQATAAYVFELHHWGRLVVTAAPEVGVGITALRGVGADSDRISSVFVGPRFGIAMAPQVANGSPAVFAARSWGAHLAVYVDPGSAWQIAVGYEWGR